MGEAYECVSDCRAGVSFGEGWEVGLGGRAGLGGAWLGPGRRWARTVAAARPWCPHGQTSAPLPTPHARLPPPPAGTPVPRIPQHRVVALPWHPEALTDYGV